MRITINNKDYRYFSDYNINLKYNSIANTFSFNAKKDILDYFLEYPECKIYNDNNELLITGTILAPNLKASTTSEFIKIQGYGIAGILEDCDIPIDLYPLQFDNLSLLDIADKILKPFGINYNFTSNVLEDLNKKYSKITIEPSTTPKELLNNLASQRGIYLTNNNFGEIVFTRYEKAKFLPKAYFEEGNPGISEINLNINSQALHSSITVLKEASKDNPDAGEYAIINPYVDKFRPKVKVLNSGDIFDVKKAARMALSGELSNIKITFKTTKYIPAGVTISLIAPSIKINKETELFVESSQIIGTINTKDNYIISCVLPDVYTDNEVKNIFK